MVVSSSSSSTVVRVVVVVDKTPEWSPKAHQGHEKFGVAPYVELCGQAAAAAVECSLSDDELCEPQGPQERNVGEEEEDRDDDDEDAGW